MVNMHSKSLPERLLIYVNRFWRILRYGEAFEPMMPSALHKICENIDMIHVAAAAQKVLEESVTAFLRPYLDPDNPLPVCLAGGVFANVLLNQMVAEIPGVKEVFVYPCMGDGGLAIGSCFLYVQEATKGSLHPRPIDNMFYGPEYVERDMEKAIEQLTEIKISRPNDMPTEIARLIYQGKVVARFSGRMEFGPRALGHRTVMAAPVDPNINAWLNKRLHRSEFMPFAPVVLEEYARGCFENFDYGRAAAQFMTITFKMTEKAAHSCPAVCHVDGTARPQTIRKDQDPEYYEILRRFLEISNLPMAINTSFNMHEEPIVESPWDAVCSFDNGGLDALALGPFLLKKPGTT